MKNWKFLKKLLATKTEQAAMAVEDRLMVLVRTIRVARTELDWAEFHCGR